MFGGLAAPTRWPRGATSWRGLRLLELSSTFGASECVAMRRSVQMASSISLFGHMADATVFIRIRLQPGTSPVPDSNYWQRAQFGLGRSSSIRTSRPASSRSALLAELPAVGDPAPPDAAPEPRNCPCSNRRSQRGAARPTPRPRQSGRPPTPTIAPVSSPSNDFLKSLGRWSGDWTRTSDPQLPNFLAGHAVFSLN